MSNLIESRLTRLYVPMEDYRKEKKECQMVLSSPATTDIEKFYARERIWELNRTNKGYFREQCPFCGSVKEFRYSGEITLCGCRKQQYFSSKG